MGTERKHAAQRHHMAQPTPSNITHKPMENGANKLIFSSTFRVITEKTLNNSGAQWKCNGEIHKIYQFTNGLSSYVSVRIYSQFITLHLTWCVKVSETMENLFQQEECISVLLQVDKKCFLYKGLILKYLHQNSYHHRVVTSSIAAFHIAFCKKIFKLATLMLFFKGSQ